MIITRTPFRISFFGGGTDYPDWYLPNGGSVLSTTIDKYCYLTVRYLPDVFEEKHRFVYSKIEQCIDNKSIGHPGIRECLKYLNFEKGLEIFHQGDLPARSGMATSSAFVVGLLSALYGLMGIYKNKTQIYEESIYIEQKLMNENVGSQDQVSTAMGGLNFIEFNKGGNINVNPIPLSDYRIKLLNKNLHLFYTGIQRNSNKFAKLYTSNISKNRRQLRMLKQFVDEGIDILCSNKNLDEFGYLLHENWLIKQSISEGISESAINNMYKTALSAGAKGGKLLGAGGGGFLLLYIKPEDLGNVKEALSAYKYIPFAMENDGTKIIYHLPNSIDSSEADITKSNINAMNLNLTSSAFCNS